MNRKNNKSISLRCIITWMSRKHSTNKTIVTIKDLLSGPSFYVLFASLFYAIRSIRYIIKPQLYAEDGAVWLADGFNLGIKSLFIPLNGFSHLFERLFGLMVAQLPLYWAPILFNLTGLLIFAITTFYLYSPRTKILTTNFERIFVLVSLCLIANVDEFFFNFSNSVFLLGIVGMLLIVARAPKNKIVDKLEKLLFVILCLTLPFAWIYIAILLYRHFRYHKKQAFLLASAGVGSIIQLFVYLNRDDARQSVNTLALLSRDTVIEVYNQIIAPSMVFARLDISPDVQLSIKKVAFLVIVYSICLMATFVVFRKSNHQTKLFILFCIGMTLASLKSPLTDLTSSKEIVNYMANVQFGDRYFIYGIICLSIIFAKFLNIYLPKRLLSFALVTFAILGLASSIINNSFWIQKNLQDYRKEYQNGVNKLNSPNNSSDIIIPTNPNNNIIIFRNKPG
ncbi:MAG: hypothetical protein U0413_02760 [Candidatus Saccharimonadales bacterium]